MKPSPATFRDNSNNEDRRTTAAGATATTPPPPATGRGSEDTSAAPPTSAVASSRRSNASLRRLHRIRSSSTAAAVMVTVLVSASTFLSTPAARAFFLKPAAGVARPRPVVAFSGAVWPRPGTDRPTKMRRDSPHVSGRYSSMMSMSSSAASSAASTTTAEPQPPPPTRKVEVRRVLSGVQPTGSLHLGNYLGAIRQWVDFQNNPSQLWSIEDEIDDGSDASTETRPDDIRTENYFCVVDLHAITMPHDPDQLEESTLASAALYLAAGIDPAKSNIFVQSHVSAHSELTWLLNCVTPMNWLERMIQYKDKAKKQQLLQSGGETGGAGGGGGVGVGLFDYPVLMAADILLYQATHVPVGEDQRQHLELARDICRRFHDLFGKGNAYKKRCKRAGIPARPVFVEPSAMIVKEGGARIMSLTDGTSKMSKSDPNDLSRINVLDPPDVIRNKIKRCKTDAVVGLEWDNADRPEATNLLNIYLAVQPERSRQDIADEVKDLTWGEFKPLLADAVIAHLQPIQDRYHQVRGDPEYLSQVLARGAKAADAVASQTLRAARVAMGFSSSSSSSS